MASIQTNTDEKIITINKWTGMNEAPDGDTKLKYGEASVMRNFYITRDGNLRRRPGQKRTLDLSTYNLLEEEPEDWGAGEYWKFVDNESVPVTDEEWEENKYYTRECGDVKCLWKGTVSGNDIVLAATNGKMYLAFYGTWDFRELGNCDTSGKVSCFAFGEKAYILDGAKYREIYLDNGSWVYQEVEGYRPLIITTCLPSGSGVTVEQINKLTGKRRVEYSPDGTSTDFHLPEKPVTSIDWVRVDGSEVTPASIDLTNGIVTFASAPSANVNSVEIAYTYGATYRSQVERMRFSELYNGTQDTRVFLYGDGSNEAFYSGIDTNTKPRADYFPDMNEMAIGEANTPITALIRHGNRLIAFKQNATWSIYYTSYTDENGILTAGFAVSPINRSIGNVALGQAQLVLNYPRTLFGTEVYEWKNYGNNLSNDERQVTRISDRIQNSIKGFILEDTIAYDDNDGQSYYLCYNKKALVHNYVANAWSYYDNFDAKSLCSFNGELYFGNSMSEIIWFTESAYDDCGNPIDAYWESGAMDFKSEWMRKYTSSLWICVKPESHSHLEITAKTDRKSDFSVKTIARGASGFAEWDFRSFSFKSNVQPQIKKLRLKAKKYVYYKLCFQTNEPGTTATVLSVDIRVRETGFAK